MTALPTVDFEKVGARFAYLVRVEYEVAGSARVLRVSGPTRAVGSGVRSDVDGSWANYEGRSDGAKVTRSLGPLKNHVQSVPVFSLSLAVSGPGDPLLSDAQTGRWGTLVVWAVELDSARRVVAAVERFRGRVDRGAPRSTERTVEFQATGGMLGIDERLISYRMPTDLSAGSSTTPYSIGDTQAIGIPSDNGRGNVVNMFHPGTYASIPNGYSSPPSWEGREIGPVYGNAYGADLAWRELVPYGANERPSIVNGRCYYFFVSPQFGCFVDEVWWSNPTNSLIRGAVQIGAATTVHHVETFNNRDERFGPVGTCAVLRTTTGYADDFSADPYPKIFGKVAGPPAGVVVGTLYSGSIELLSRGAGDYVDSDIIERIFEEVGFPNELGIGAISAFSAGAPSGSSGSNTYRRFHASVPQSVGDEIPMVRDALGELCSMVGADIAQRTDPVDGVRRLFPVRRKPNPVDPDPDHTVRKGDLLGAHASAVAGWSVRPDPDGHYCSVFSAEGPSFTTHPLQAGSDPSDNLEPSRRYSAEIEIPAELQYGRVRRKFRGKFWTHEQLSSGLAAHSHSHGSGGGFDDFAEIAASERGQRQWSVEVEMGPKGFSMELGDSVRLDLPGLELSDGHLRKVQEDLTRWSCRITVYIGSFFAGSHAAPVENEDDETHEDGEDPN